LFISLKRLSEAKPGTGFMGGIGSPPPVLADVGAAIPAARPAGKPQSNIFHE
jgi:hypothetical protein